MLKTVAGAVAVGCGIGSTTLTGYYRDGRITVFEGVCTALAMIGSVAAYLAKSPLDGGEGNQENRRVSGKHVKSE